jgi:hypothetical protein
MRTGKRLPPLERERGTKDIVALTVRLPRGEWERLHQLAAAEGVSLQTLTVRGLSLVFRQKGLAAIKQ